MDHNKTELIPIPLPTEIPEPPSLDQLPLDILHSATVEMLIQQNEDLSSRLKVNIRRNSQQEQKILELKKELDHFERKNENLKAQNEIVKEKEQIWMRQKEEQNRKMETINKEMNLMELRYNELYTTTKQKQKELYKQVVDKNKAIEKLQKKLHVFQKIRIRAKDRLRNFLLQAAQSMQQGQSHATKTLSQNRLLKKQFEFLSHEVEQKEKNFRQHLEDIKRISKEKLEELLHFNMELKQRLQAKDSRYEELNAEYKQLLEQLAEEKKNRAKISSLAREVTELKNEKIKEKRDYIGMIKQLQDAQAIDSTNRDSQKKVTESLQKQLRESKEALHACENQLLELRNDNRDLQDQLENLQTLWLNAQSQLEKEQLKAKTLEKINKELSRSYKEERIEKSVTRSQEMVDQPPTQKPNNNINTKLTEVYASQYTSFDKGKQPEL